MNSSCRFSQLLHIIGLLLLISCSSDTKTLKITPSKLDFGDVNLGEIVDIEVTLKNKFGKDVTILNMNIIGSYDFIITSGCIMPIDLLKNAEHKMIVTFVPSLGGPNIATLFIAHDASNKPKEVGIKGVGIPVARIKLSDTIFNFDKKIINRNHTHDIEIENFGTLDLEISNLSFTGLGAAVYSISAGGPTPINIAPGATKTITIAFDPVVIGTFSADLEIHHNAVNENSPIIYPITGEGVDVDPQITLSQPSPWDFGSVATTMPATQICEIENTGIDPLTVTSAVLKTGLEFTIESLKDSNSNVISFPQIIAVSAKIYLSIKFEPTAKTTFNDTLTFIHDGTNEVTPWDIPLAGEGRDLITKTFTYTGAKEQYKLPAGVNIIVVELYGAEGGDAYPPSGGNDPGKGGKVSATLTVSPGAALEIYVGGKGIDGNLNTGGNGGWNDGGSGGTFGMLQMNGGGGGGASDIREGGTALTDRIVVAGAGGGGGGFINGNNGGSGGGLVGGAGYFIMTPDPLYGGGGGTQTQGGAAATSGGTATAGSLGKGGDASGVDICGGGGGSGYYGGGGGTYGGGGGGSSFTKQGATNVVHQQGVRSSNGEVTINY